jgi:hypothetical protein
MPLRPTIEMDSEFDDTDYATEGPLPTLTRTHYDRSPMHSRLPSRGQSPPTNRRLSSHHDGAFDETISILDPRRFTPTLHANLVAEILSLRRELESKNQLVETLEGELDETRADAENATANVATALKEARDVKRQLARAEKDDAMAVVAHERDEAVTALEDLKKQMERLAKSRRAAEDDLEQLRKSQERDNEKFEEAKRGFERRAHVAEGRLKAVLDELATRANAMPGSPPPPRTNRSHQRVMSEDYGDSPHSDSASIRSIPFSDRPGSLMMGDNEAERLGISMHGNGLSLADELNFDDSEEEGTATHDEAYPGTDAEDMISDAESEEEIDELPEVVDFGVQVVPEISYEERLQELEDLLGERASELERMGKTLGQRTEELDALHAELDKSQNLVFDLQAKLDLLNAQGAKTDQDYEVKKQELEEKLVAFNTMEQEKKQAFEMRIKELDLRSSELDTRSSELDTRSSELNTRSSELDKRSSELETQSSELETRLTWLDARSLDLDEVVDELEATKKINDERSVALDDREIELEERERVLSAEEAEIKELKEWVDSELTMLKEGKEEPVNLLELEPFSKTADAFTEPPPLVYISTESQTAELPSSRPPARPVYISAESQTDKPPFRRPPARPVYATAEVQTDKVLTRRPVGRPMYTTTEVQTEKLLRKSPAYVSTESQTIERPSPKPPVYISTESQTAELPSPKPPVCVSTESQTIEVPPPVCVSAESQTIEIPPPVCISAESQTIEIPPPVCISAESQTIEIPPPPPPAYITTDVQTTELPMPKPPVCISTEAQTEIPSLKPQAYISTESQTTGLPSPPATPLRDTHQVLMQSTGIQTDHDKPVKPAKPTVIHVPAITVSPPEPSPQLPKPVMRDAVVQTRPIRQRTRSMQTEQIGLDERLRKFAPHLLPSALGPKITVAPEEPTPPPPPRRSSKRTARRAATAPVPAPEEPVVPRSATTSEAPISISTSDMGVDTSTLYTSPKTDDDFEVSRIPSPKKMVPKNIFNNIDFSPENEVHSSDEFQAEEGDSGNEYRTALSARPSKSLRSTPQFKLNLETDIRRQPTIRRGSKSHARIRSPSVTSNHTFEHSGNSTKIGPPFPVPTRHSSKRPGYLSDRDRATPSPIPTAPKVTRNNSRQKRPQSIRKVRSATILPSTRDGSISPGVFSNSSNTPSSPGLPPPLPIDNIASPAFDRRRFGETNHRHQASINTSNTSQTGDTGHASVGATQQTSVVDAIAQTMVGEWMWKYVRRKKSFGISEAADGDDSTGGQRHKRWVWLAPYERAVMWSSRQPTSGSALLGKSGRKRKRSILHPFGGQEFSEMMDRVLTKKVLIQSVLDVKDDTPPPKGATQPVFNRSILILTPARALKFTAPTKERHYVWLTALSFLSHSPESGDGLLALPPPMPFEYDQLDRRQNNPDPAPPPIPSAPPARAKNAFSTTRDSVRLAKGKTRATPASNGLLSVNTSRHLEPRVSMESNDSGNALPPSIPRFPGSRRRSNSNVHLHRPQTRSGYEQSLDSYKTTIASSNRDSFGPDSFSNRDSFRPDSFYGVGGIGITSPTSSLAPYGGGGGGGTGLWDPGPIGTMRMEAFIDRRLSTYSREYDELDLDDSASLRLRERRMSRHERYWNGGGGGGGGGYPDEEDFWRGDDPFRNF